MRSNFTTLARRIPTVIPNIAWSKASPRVMAIVRRVTSLRLMSQCHAGILTSWFEGMPCYLLELLSVGRPIVAVSLPQYGLVVEDGRAVIWSTATLTLSRLIEALSERFLATWSAIRSGAMTPDAIHAQIIPFSVDAQLKGHFARHQRLLPFRRYEHSKGSASGA